jgi:hypothetical protein
MRYTPYCTAYREETQMFSRVCAKRGWRLSVAAAVLGSVATAGIGIASTRGRTVAALSTTTRDPARSTGLGISIHYRDEHDPNAKPKTFSKLVIELPAGLRIDAGAVPACTASDAQLMAEGPSACDPRSRVGGGTVTLTTGFPPPADTLVADVAILQGKGELLDVFRARGSDQTLAVDHVKIAGRTLVDQPQAVPGGPPDGRSAVRDVKLHIDARTAFGGRVYLRTPPSCPGGDGLWRSRFTVSYDDGVKDVALATTPCSRPAPQPKPHRRDCGHDRDRLTNRRCASNDPDNDD